MKHLTFREITARAFNRISRKLGLTQKLLAEEQLENLLREDKRQRFIADLLSIRQSGQYIPDYNRPKKFTEYQLEDVSAETFTSCQRPQDFVGKDGSLINATSNWLNSIREQNQIDLSEKEKKEAEFNEFMAKRYRNLNLIMNSFMKVN